LEKHRRLPVEDSPVDRSPFPVTPSRATLLLNPVVQKALTLLLEGSAYASDLGISPWEFSIDVATLLAAGCTPNTLRWLTLTGLAEYKVLHCGTTSTMCSQEAGRENPVPAGICFILTPLGIATAQGLSPNQVPCGVGNEGGSIRGGAEVPRWDSCQGELWFRSRLVKRFRNAASNQRALLDAFQQSNWPERLRDPLPRPAAGSVNLKQRLHDTIKNLNRGHAAHTLHFYGAEAGRAVGWKPCVNVPNVPQPVPILPT
jgi:hypothetical protein